MSHPYVVRETAAPQASFQSLDNALAYLRWIESLSGEGQVLRAEDEARWNREREEWEAP